MERGRRIGGHLLVSGVNLLTIAAVILLARLAGGSWHPSPQWVGVVVVVGVGAVAFSLLSQLVSRRLRRRLLGPPPEVSWTVVSVSPPRHGSRRPPGRADDNGS